jgi:ketosteroid isomerase-like protein
MSMARKATLVPLRVAHTRLIFDISRASRAFISTGVTSRRQRPDVLLVSSEIIESNCLIVRQRGRMYARRRCKATSNGILNPMLRLLLAPALAALSYAQSSSTAQAAVLSAVHQFVDAFNKGDVKTVIATCAAETSILDEFPPHEWHGSGACAKWLTDFDADAKKNSITDGIVTLRTPSHVDINGDRAYVVIPADYNFKQKGKPMVETGSVVTLTLRKLQPGWRVSGWSWAKH